MGNAENYRHRVIGRWGFRSYCFLFPYRIFGIFALRVQFVFFLEALKNVEKSTKNEESLSMSRTKEFGFQQAFHMVGEGGFEPPKALPADLQSVPFGHSGIPPYSIGDRHGAGGRIRTPDLLITNQLLYQLSYTSTPSRLLPFAECLYTIQQVSLFVKHNFRTFSKKFFQ